MVSLITLADTCACLPPPSAVEAKVARRDDADSEAVAKGLLEKEAAAAAVGSQGEEIEGRDAGPVGLHPLFQGQRGGIGSVAGDPEAGHRNDDTRIDSSLHKNSLGEVRVGREFAKELTVWGMGRR